MRPTVADAPARTSTRRSTEFVGAVAMVGGGLLARGDGDGGSSCDGSSATSSESVVCANALFGTAHTTLDGGYDDDELRPRGVDPAGRGASEGLICRLGACAAVAGGLLRLLAAASSMMGGRRHCQSARGARWPVAVLRALLLLTLLQLRRVGAMTLGAEFVSDYTCDVPAGASSGALALTGFSGGDRGDASAHIAATILTSTYSLDAEPTLILATNASALVGTPRTQNAPNGSVRRARRTHRVDYFGSWPSVQPPSPSPPTSLSSRPPPVAHDQAAPPPLADAVPARDAEPPTPAHRAADDLSTIFLLVLMWAKTLDQYRERKRSTTCLFVSAVLLAMLVSHKSLASTIDQGGDGGSGGGGATRQGYEPMLPPLHVGTSARHSSAAAVLPPLGVDGTFDCAARSAVANDLLQTACFASKMSGSPGATVVAVLAAALANDEEVAHFEAAHSYCSGEAVHVVRPFETTIIAIRSMARFEAGECAAVAPERSSVRLDLGMRASQRFEIGDEGSADAVYHVVAKMPSLAANRVVSSRRLDEYSYVLEDQSYSYSTPPEESYNYSYSYSNGDGGDAGDDMTQFCPYGSTPVCPNTCYDLTCDYIVEVYGGLLPFTCEVLENDYGCDCSGCFCGGSETPGAVPTNAPTTATATPTFSMVPTSAPSVTPAPTPEVFVGTFPRLQTAVQVDGAVVQVVRDIVFSSEIVIDGRVDIYSDNGAVLSGGGASRLFVLTDGAALRLRFRWWWWWRTFCRW